MNSSAAFNFLREMEDRKMQEYEEEEKGSDEQKIVFKNSKKLAPTEIAEPSTKRVKGNKFVMPEYVIGEKKNKQTKKETAKGKSSSSSSKQLKLTHLEEEEEETE